MLSLEWFGTTTADIDPTGVVFHANLGLPGKTHRGRLAAIAYGGTVTKTRFGGRTTFNAIVARFDDGRVVTIACDCSGPSEALRIATEVSRAVGAPVEGTLPRLPRREQIRLTWIVCSLTIGPIAAAFVGWFIAAGPYHRHGSYRPLPPEPPARTALPRPR